jgi:prophage tail gpP-like protein
MPKAVEKAELVVAGNRFTDWETVWVQCPWRDAWSYFKFTAAERDPVVIQNVGTVALWTKLQFKPGDKCQIVLAGQLAITGWIDTREVAYDSETHEVLLIGKSDTAEAARSSVDHPTGNFDGQTILQIGNTVASRYGVGVQPIGNVDQQPFDKMHCEKGELVWDFLERICRLRNTILGSDSLGNFLMIGEHNYPVVGRLYEGVNIKRCNCIISSANLFGVHQAVGQAPASDDNSGTAASALVCNVPGGNVNLKAMLITPLEQPVKTQAEVCKRASYEALWHESTQIQCTIIVQGWTRDGENLWRAGDQAYVYSPMAMLDMVLAIDRVTFTQDSSGGTQTQLDLIAPWALKGSYNFDFRLPSEIPQQQGT